MSEENKTPTEYEYLFNRREAIEAEVRELHDETDPLKKRLSGMILRKTKGPEVAELSAKVLAIDGELRDLNYEKNRIERQLGQLRRQRAHVEREKAPVVLTKYGIFHQVAREILPEETFLRIWNIVEGRMRVAGATILDDESGQPMQVGDTESAGNR